MPSPPRPAETGVESIASIWELPLRPAVYALFGIGPSRVPIFVGVADALRHRVVEQLVIGVGSPTRGHSALPLDPIWIEELRWWEQPGFDDHHTLRAAEFIASDLLEPVLRSRVRITEQARRVYDDEHFQGAMRVVFTGAPTGSLRFPTVAGLEARLDEIERRLAALQDKLASAPRGERSPLPRTRVDL